MMVKIYYVENANWLRQGLLYKWTEHWVLTCRNQGEAFNPNNVTQTHSIFVKL